MRRILFGTGMRYRVGYRPVQELRRTADIAFPRQRIAVFIDGCFWHGCPQHYVASKSNVHYWSSKIETNVRRDRDTDKALQALGWTVLRFWSHEDAGIVAEAIANVVRKMQPPRGQ